MQAHYVVTISEPQTHYVYVTLTLSNIMPREQLAVFLPTWCPGSYFIRDYAKNVVLLQANNREGKPLVVHKSDKTTWTIDCQDLLDGSLTVEYQVYCHEVSVRSAYIDVHHAFLHGASYLIGVEGENLPRAQLQLHLPRYWTQISTGLRRLDEKIRLYQAQDYADLLDCPIEIGQHHISDFHVANLPHNVAIYGDVYPHPHSLISDMQAIVQTVSEFMGGVPYDDYTFIIHFIPECFGGLEHANSCALHYDGRLFSDPAKYRRWLSLVAHEYFHVWNGKRLMVKELVKLDHRRETYTDMLWLTEGLTSFLDDFFVLRSGLCDLDTYLNEIKDNLNRYYSISGRHVQSLQASSYDAWIKLYRREENTANMTVSYYLKGALVFGLLHLHLRQHGRHIRDLVLALWGEYCQNATAGVTIHTVLHHIKTLTNVALSQQFYLWLTSTHDADFDFENAYRSAGVAFEWETEAKMWLGAEFEYRGENVFIKHLQEGSPAQQQGLSAGDEIIAINRQRLQRVDMKTLDTWLLPNKRYVFSISRLKRVLEVEMTTAVAPAKLKALRVVDMEKAEAAFLE